MMCLVILDQVKYFRNVFLEDLLIESCNAIFSEEGIFLNNLNFALPSDEEWAMAQLEDPNLGPYIRWISDKVLPAPNLETKNNKVLKDDSAALKILRESDHYYLGDNKILYY